MGRTEKWKNPFLKAAAAACLIICVDLGFSACSGSSENVTLLTAEESADAVSTADVSTADVLTADAAGSSAAEEASGETSIYVFVCGAVEHPGVYQMPEGARVYEAVAAAGGFSLEADETAVNQALVLSDQDQLVIPERRGSAEEENEAGTADSGNGSFSENGEGSGTGGAAGGGVISGGGIISSGTGTSGAAGSGQSAGTQTVNINTADAALLETLPGIGSTKAAAIVAYREQNGAFGTIEDLKKVSGIGDATFDKMKDRISVN